jgi:hypothetical protein
VSFSRLKRNIAEGGLKAPCIYSKDIAHKLVWIKRVIYGENANWKLTFQAFLPNFTIRDLCLSRSNFQNHDLLIDKIPMFYKDLIKYWNKYQLVHQPDTALEVSREFIWFNDYIQIDGKSVFYKKWYDAGIKYVHHIVKNDGDIMSIEDIENKYNVQAHFLELYSIRAAIPFSWRQKLRMGNPAANGNYILELQIHSTVGFKALENMQCKDYYWSWYLKKKPLKAPVLRTEHKNKTLPKLSGRIYFTWRLEIRWKPGCRPSSFLLYIELFPTIDVCF